ncbi:hypothetical protein D3C84_928620 [compost metagenome]
MPDDSVTTASLANNFLMLAFNAVTADNFAFVNASLAVEAVAIFRRVWWLHIHFSLPPIRSICTALGSSDTPHLAGSLLACSGAGSCGSA